MNAGRAPDAPTQQAGSRVQFAKLRDVWNKIVPVTQAPPIQPLRDTSRAALRDFAERQLAAMPETVKTPDGITVSLRHLQEGGTIEGLYSHLTTRSDGSADAQRAMWIPRIPTTLQNSQGVRVPGRQGNRIYISRYADRGGHRSAHFVIVSGQGHVLDHGDVAALKSHFARSEKKGVQLGDYAELEATPLWEAPPMSASDSRGATDTPGNISAQSTGVSGSTVESKDAPRTQFSQPRAMTVGQLVEAMSQRRSGDAKPATRKAVTDALTLLKSRLPGLQNNRVLTFANAAEFLASGYAREGTFTAEETAGMQDAEAFYDTLTGHTIVFTDQITLREGETPIRAVARVLLHERVGHQGLNTLLAQDARAAARWSQLAAQIPAAEFDAIAAEAGYTHLATDRAQLALEWLARQVETIDGARNAAAIERSLTGAARQLWQALKEMLAKVFANFSRAAAFAHEVHEIITLARAAALSGTADPTTPEALAHRLQFSQNAANPPHGHAATHLPVLAAGPPHAGVESAARRLRGAFDAARIAFTRLGAPVTEAEALALGLAPPAFAGLGPQGVVFAPHRLTRPVTDRYAQAVVQEELIHAAWFCALEGRQRRSGCLTSNMKPLRCSR